MKKFEEIKVPTIAISCPICGAVIFGSVLYEKPDKSLMSIDFMRSAHEAMYKYGKQGCLVSVVEAGSIKLELCEHTKNLK